MLLRFACPKCGRHISATRAQIGVTLRCPNCNAPVAVPKTSTLPPPPAPLVRFACPTCGQHLSATRDQIGETAPCPNCNAEVMVPVQSTLAPPLLRFSPQPQEPAQNPKSASIKRRRTQISWKAAAVIILVATIVIVAGMSQSIKDQPRREAERRAANRADNATALHDLAERAHQDTELAKKGKIRVGMTADQCRMAWGEPDRISRNKTHEQWVYPNGNRLYFDDEVLKSIHKTTSREDGD
jgi:DNA-directed RNA polymerase subunit RPC12/RpoP